MAATTPVQSTTMSHPRGCSSSSALVTVAVAAQLLRRLQPRRVEVDHADAGGARPLGQLHHHQAHRAGAVDQVVVAQARREHVEAADRARQRLDQRRVRRARRRGGSTTQLATGATAYSAAPPARRDADRGPALAQVAPAAPAVVALAAVQRRVDRDLVADPQLRDVRTDRDDLAGELVPRARSGASGRTRRRRCAGRCRRCRTPATATTTSRGPGVGSGTVSTVTSSRRSR